MKEVGVKTCEVLKAEHLREKRKLQRIKEQLHNVWASSDRIRSPADLSSPLHHCGEFLHFKHKCKLQSLLRLLKITDDGKRQKCLKMGFDLVMLNIKGNSV